MNPVFASPARGDRPFERLYRRHAADVYRYAYAVLQNRADAEDVTQTTFMNAYRALERGERPDRPHNWLIAITHNVCRQRFRQSQRRPSEVEWHEDLPDQLVADDEGPSAEDIRRALGYLPFNQRAALVMRELEGRSYAEIAEVLDVTAAAVETLIFRARRALREQLEGSLTCGEAELAISKQLDGRLTRAEKGQLRAHLRECPECATFARRQRGQRTALKSLGAIPLPASLASFFGGGGAPVGVVAAKAVAVAAAAVLAGGASYEAVQSVGQSQPRRSSRAVPARREVATLAAAVPAAPAPAAPARRAKTKAHGGAVHVHGARRLRGAPGKRHAAHGRGHRAAVVTTTAHGRAAPAAAANPAHPVHSGRGGASASHAHGAAPVASAAHAAHAKPAGHANRGEHSSNGHERSNGSGSMQPSEPAAHGNQGHGGDSSPVPAQPAETPPAHAPPTPGPPPGKRGASFSP